MEIPYKLNDIFLHLKIHFFLRINWNYYLENGNIDPKIGMHDPCRHLQKIDKANLDISIFANFTAAEIGKNVISWQLSSQTAQ